MLRRPSLALPLAALLLVGGPGAALAQASSPASTAAEAKSRLAAGDKAAAAKNWAAAAKEYGAAQEAAPSGAALAGLGNAHYELKNLGPAYEAYDALLKRFPNALGKRAQTQAEARFKELAQKTGALNIRVSEPGAAVSLDDQPLGTSPVAAVIRVPVGARKIRVTKEGFVPFEKTEEVGPDKSVAVDARLEGEAKSGRLAVKEKSGQTLRVLVDGLDVGATPWEGDIAPGSHEVFGRSSVASAPKQTVEVQKGKVTEVELVGSTSGGRVEITTSDGQGIIYVDGKVVAEGAFSGELAAGPHVLLVKREGFEPFEKRFELADKQIVAETVTLRRIGGPVADEKVAVERLFVGPYGGLSLLGSTQIVGPDNTVTKSCSLLGASDCEGSFPLGGALLGYLGYMWNPVGLEIFGGAMYDQSTPRANYDGVVAPGSNPVLTGPARVEQFGFFRAGALGSARVRVMADGPVLRYGAAFGVGFAYRSMFMLRRTRTQNGQNLSDRHLSDSDSVLSPALNVELFGQWRISATTALTFGVSRGWRTPARSRAGGAQQRSATPIAASSSPSDAGVHDGRRPAGVHRPVRRRDVRRRSSGAWSLGGGPSVVPPVARDGLARDWASGATR